MAAELPRPGVQVIQEFRTTSPSIVSPTLVPTVVGACNQIVDVLNGQNLNTDARVSLPVYFVATEASLVGIRYIYAGLNTKTLSFFANNSPQIDVVFESDALTPAAVCSAVNEAMNAVGVFDVVAETVQSFTVAGALKESTWRLRSIAEGDLQRVQIGAATSDEVAAAFGLKQGWVFEGKDFYDGEKFVVPWLSFPDPRNNLSELTFDSSSFRMFFVAGSTNIRELSRTSGFCRRGATICAFDDGNGDAVTPLVSVAGADFTAAATATTLVGSVLLAGLTLPADLQTKTLTLKTATREQTYTFVNTTARPLTAAQEVLDQLNAFFTEVLFSVSVGGTLVVETLDKGQDAVIEVLSGTAKPVLGLMAIPGSTELASGVVYPDDLQTKTVTIDGTTLTFAGGAPTNEAALLAALEAAFAGYDFSVNAAGNLVITKAAVGSIVIGEGTANAELGLTPGTYGGYTVGTAFPAQAGDELFIEGTSFGAINQVAPGAVTSLLRLTRPVAMSTRATAAGTVDLVGLTYPGGFTDKAIQIGAATHTFTGVHPADEATLLIELAAAFPGYTFTVDISGAAHYLRITKVAPGPFTLGAATNLPVGLTNATYHPVLGTNFYIVAKNLSTNTRRPVPEFRVVNGSPVLAPYLIRNTSGAPITANSQVYMAYEALRKDVSPMAERPGLLKLGGQAELSSLLSPISTRNPLALGLYFALLNAVSTQVTGIGVDTTSADMPEGTVEAYSRAAEFLEGVEVYAIAPLTHDPTVAEIFNAHVSAMSEPENRGERIVLFNTSLPTHALDTLVASGAEGNSQGENTFDTQIANLSALLLNAGVPNPVGTIDSQYGVFLDVASSALRYSVQAVNGSIVTLRMTFSNGENDDGFYAQSPVVFPPNSTPLINETFAIRIRGAALTLPNGRPDKDAIADTCSAYAQTFQNRRFWHMIPSQCAATINGVEQVIEGYYMCAAYAGLIAGQPPQQSFTNFPLTGFTRVIGSNGYFSERQLNRMAAGGNWIVVQDAERTPLISRMAVTSDMTSVETRTDSITKVVDFTAKILRRGIRNFIGRFNITQGFMDSLGTVGQGILGFLTDNGVLIGGSMNNIIQDEGQPDQVLIDVVIDPPYPCNYIRLTLLI
jgi:hypothetical protein